MNIKKFLTVLILGLAVFAVSCGTTDATNDDAANSSSSASFKTTVADKTIVSLFYSGYTDTADECYSIYFSADGSYFTWGGYDYDLSSETSSTIAAYKTTYNSIEYTMTITVNSDNSVSIRETYVDSNGTSRAFTLSGKLV